MTNRRAGWLGVFIVAAGIAGCGDTTPPASDTIAGKYVLQSINAKPLPFSDGYVITEDSTTVSFTILGSFVEMSESDSLRLIERHRLRLTSKLGVTIYDSLTTDTTRARWTLADSIFALTMPTGTKYPVTYHGKRRPFTLEITFVDTIRIGNSGNNNDIDGILIRTELFKK